MVLCGIGQAQFLESFACSPFSKGVSSLSPSCQSAPELASLLGARKLCAQMSPVGCYLQARYGRAHRIPTAALPATCKDHPATRLRQRRPPHRAHLRRLLPAAGSPPHPPKMPSIPLPNTPLPTATCVLSQTSPKYISL